MSDPSNIPQICITCGAAVDWREFRNHLETHHSAARKFSALDVQENFESLEIDPDCPTVIVEVRGGVAKLMYSDSDAQVIVLDYDNLARDPALLKTKGYIGYEN